MIEGQQRRAQAAEQRLGRLEDACLELEQLLIDYPGHPSALRWLADLYERAGEPQKALPALERLFAATNEEIEYVSLGVRRVRALVASAELDRRTLELERRAELLAEAGTRRGLKTPGADRLSVSSESGVRLPSGDRG